MAVNRKNRPLVGYGLDNALQNLAPAPIVAQRDPTTNDSAELGTLWINPSDGGAWVLTAIVAGQASWLSLG